MVARVGTSAWFALITALLCCNPSLAGLNEGLAALAKADYPTAVKELRPLAERGDAEAQYRIGLMFEFGRGYPIDKAQGIAWFRKAAAQNHTAALQELGVIYATGDGVPKDDAQAVSWFRKAAELGNPTAQFNLGLMIAKGTGAPKDDALAVSWFRKAANQGMVGAQFKLGVAYENGNGVAKDPVLAYVSYAIAARGGNQESATHRDSMAPQLSAAQAQQAQAMARTWAPGQPMPTGVAAAGMASATTTAAATKAAPSKDRCTANGQMGGTAFKTAHCAVSLYQDNNSVAIWFNEDPISPQEVEEFQLSSYAKDTKDGKPRTKLQVMFCPGGGKSVPSAAAMKTLDLNTNHAKSALAGVQWVVDAGKDFKVEKMSGEIKPGGVLAGKISGGRDKTTFMLDFEVTLPAKDAAAGLSCGK